MRPHFAGYPRVRIRVVEKYDVALLAHSADAAKVSSRGTTFAEAAPGGQQPTLPFTQPPIVNVPFIPGFARSAARLPKYGIRPR